MWEYSWKLLLIITCAAINQPFAMIFFFRRRLEMEWARGDLIKVRISEFPGYFEVKGFERNYLDYFDRACCPWRFLYAIGFVIIAFGVTGFFVSPTAIIFDSKLSTMISHLISLNRGPMIVTGILCMVCAALLDEWANQRLLSPKLYFDKHYRLEMSDTSVAVLTTKILYQKGDRFYVCSERELKAAIRAVQGTG
jgi:hypothetical protein